MFPIEPGKDYAVITGDVIGSSDLEAAERRALPDTLHAIGGELLDWLGEDAVSPLSVFGGDSWRVLLARPGDALRAALFVRASLLASPIDADSRLAIAIGGVDFVPDGGIEEADGEAFRLSGRLLKEGLGKKRTVGFESPSSEATAHWDLVCRLVGALIDATWTVSRDSASSSRGRAVTGALRGWKHAEIGERLWPTSVSPQAIGKSLAEAQWSAIESALEAYEAGYRE